jgi:hydroxymethylbilane synthase
VDTVRIGTRGSKLALTQAGMMQRAIAAALGADPADAERVAPLVVISTTGDRVQDRRLTELGGKAMFTKEIEDALTEGRIDCAVHSMKDVPIARQRGLVLAATTEREDPRDAFLSPAYASLAEMPPGARLGTSGIRRAAQQLHRRPDIEVVMMRGNVDTRLRKLEAGEADATLLAMAGLNRLGMADRIRTALDPLDYPPAPGQGALAIETRDADAHAPWARALNHAETALCVAAERGALETLEGSCHTAIGCYARMDAGQLRLIVEALTLDGAERFRRESAIPSPTPETARALGLSLGAQIHAQAGDKLLAP